MYLIKTIVLGVLIGLLGSCKDDNVDLTKISGTVIDAKTEQPIHDVKVSLLEGGPTTFTDGEGKFHFSADDLSFSSDIEKISEDGLVMRAGYFSHDNYRPRESNFVHGETTIIELVANTLPSYYYNQPVQLNDGIETGTLQESDIDSQHIQNLMDRLYGDAYKEIHSVLVYRNDKLVLEEYFFGNNDTIQFENNITVDDSPEHIQWSRTEKHYVASANKAFTSTLVGIALDQHNISLNTRISDFLPNYQSYFEDPNKASIDFEDCLTMTAGFQWDEWGSNDLALLWKTDDFASFVLNRENHGQEYEWRYNSALPNLLLKAVDNMVGGSVRTWAHDNFYQKLGITDYNWQYQPDGYPEGSARMFIRSRDMLKIGVTYLNNGIWNGEQVIPQQWVEECFKVKVGNESSNSGDYSYYFWLRNLDGVDYLSADGDGGNYINIFPSLNMVVVITQGNYLKWPFYVSQVDDMMENYIIPATQ